MITIGLIHPQQDLSKRTLLLLENQNHLNGKKTGVIIGLDLVSEKNMDAPKTDAALSAVYTIMSSFKAGRRPNYQQIRDKLVTEGGFKRSDILTNDMHL